MVIYMKLLQQVPQYQSIQEIDNYEIFLQHGQPEIKKFLMDLLNLNDVQFQTGKLDKLKHWLGITELNPVQAVPTEDNKICLVSQIVANSQVIAYFPYVLVGRDIKKYLCTSSFLQKLSEAVSDQITLCYLMDFNGGDWLFGDSFAQIVIANCVSSSLYNGLKFAHLIEKMQQLSMSTFEGQAFTTGVIVSKDISKYKESTFRFVNNGKENPHNIDEMDKRIWFLANGETSFFLMDTDSNIRSIYTRAKSYDLNNFDADFQNYYLSGVLKAPDFIVRTLGPNEISVLDATGKEFVKIENKWRYRHKRNFVSFLTENLSISEDVGKAIKYYVIKCSRNHISTIIWLPKDCSETGINPYITEDRVRHWDKKLNILTRSNEAIIDKVLASDGAILIETNGDIMYESVFSKVEERKSNTKESKMKGTGETAAKFLSSNGIAIKVSQDGTIKVFFDTENIVYI